MDSTGVRRERAKPLSPEERREAIIAATRPLLHEHGQNTTTRLIAEAAGIAEGTIFRIFSTKDELFDAVLEREFDPEPFLEKVAAIDTALPLEQRLTTYIEMLQARFFGIFGLMASMGMQGPPAKFRDEKERRRIHDHGLVALIAGDAERFTLSVERVAELIRGLTFSASHPHITDAQPLTPTEIVNVVLHGVLKDPKELPC